EEFANGHAAVAVEIRQQAANARQTRPEEGRAPIEVVLPCSRAAIGTTQDGRKGEVSSVAGHGSASLRLVSGGVVSGGVVSGGSGSWLSSPLTTVLFLVKAFPLSCQTAHLFGGTEPGPEVLILLELVQDLAESQGIGPAQDAAAMRREANTQDQAHIHIPRLADN